MALHGMTWEFTELDGYETPIKDAHLNDVVSAQIGIELEKGVGAKFAPGQIVRLRVTYRTAGKGRGGVYFQNADDHKVFDRATLLNSNSEWKTVELITTRNVNPLRCLIDTNEKGAGNTLSSTISAATPDASSSSTVRMTFNALP